MSTSLCNDDYIWAHCSPSTLAFISRIDGPEGDLASNLWQQAQIAGKQAHRTDFPEDFDRAIALGALAIKHLEKKSVKANFRQYGYNWCYLLEKKWLMSGDDADKAHLIAGWTKFLETGFLYYSDWYRSLDTENLQSRHSYQKISNEENWKKCYQIAEILILATHGRREEAYATSQLGILAYARGFSASNVATRKTMFEASLSYQEKAVSLLKADEPVNHGIYYGHIAYSHANLWETEQIKFTERLQHCNTAIEYFEKTVHLLGSENGAWKGCSDRLARLYWARWKESYKDNDADSGIRVFESVLDIHPNDPHAQSGLAELYSQRANIMVMSNVQRRRETDKSLQLLENVIVQTALTDEALPSRLGKCSNVLKDRFAYDGSIHDVDVAIELQKAALGLPQTPQGSLWFHYAQLSSYWTTRYHHTRIQSDLTSGEEAARDALKAAGRTPVCRARGLEELACIQCISYQFGVSQKNGVIDDAISNFRQAMELRPDWRSVSLLRNLGGALLIKFDRGGSYQAASEGINYLREAVDILRRLSGKGNNQDEIGTISILANALVKRYQRFPGLGDLDEAIRLYRNILKIIDEEHVKSTDYIVDLCFALGLRYEITRDDADIAEAQQRAETAISYLNERTSPSERYRLENTLGIAFLRRYNVKEDLDSIVAAFIHFQKCLEPTSSAEMREAATANLAQAFRLRAISTKAKNDYLEATQFYFHLLSERKNSSTLPDSSVLECMAEVAWSYWIHDGGPNSTEARTAGLVSLRAFCQLLQHKQAKTDTKIGAAAKASQLSYLLEKDLEGAKRYGKLALDSLIEAAMLGLSRLDHLRIVKRFSYIPGSNLCYSILGEEAPEKALQDFESARSLIWNRLLNDKSPVDDLKVNHAELAHRFEALRIQLAESREPISCLDTDRMKFTAPDYYKTALEYSELLNQIRMRHGFEDFLLTPSNIRDMQEFARDGPIVVVNLTPWYSHAILLNGTKVQNIELPVRDHNGKDYHDGFEVALKKLSQDLPAATNILGQVMQLLWDGIAKPILDALGFEKPTVEGPLPRMWWVTTGWLNVLPIHSAATFSDFPGGTIVDSVMDRVVSSYVPNLRALKFARKRRDAILKDVQSPGPGSALFVLMPETPGHDPLPNAEKEIDETARIVKNFYTCIRSDRPMRNQVLREMKRVSMMHFVCHGIADEDDPTKSRLLLSDHLRSPFDVRACHKAELDKCRLAYLSACETAMTKNLALKDEGIHIANAVLMAGVPDVIATWWQVVDEASVSVASGFYENLIDDCGGFDTARSARAIHAAAKAVRDRGTNPFIWAAYVHFGA